MGDEGAIYLSLDGANWQRQPVAFRTWLRSVAYGNPSGADTFVAVGEDGFTAVSSDGTSWQALAPLTTAHLNKVAWQQGQFVSAGEGGIVLSSADGRSWRPVSAGSTNTLYALAASPGAWLIAGDSEVRLKEGAQWEDQFASSVLFPPQRWTYLSALWDNVSLVLGGRTGMLVEGFGAR